MTFVGTMIGTMMSVMTKMLVTSMSRGVQHVGSIHHLVRGTSSPPQEKALMSFKIIYAVRIY